jgi:hypothetical protein
MLNKKGGTIMKTKLVLLILSLILYFNCTGQPGKDGLQGLPGQPGLSWMDYIETDTTWSEDIYLNRSVFIDGGVTLTIAAGVKVYLYPDNSIRCYGNIIAEGTSNNFIRIKKALTSGNNCNLFFYSGSSNIFKYCEFDSLEEITIKDTGIYVNIDSCIIKNAYSYGIKATHTPNLILINSDIIDNNYGICGTSFGDGITYLSNNFIAYNNGSSIIALSTLSTDPDTPNNYGFLSQNRINPRAIPNF